MRRLLPCVGWFGLAAFNLLTPIAGAAQTPQANTPDAQTSAALANIEPTPQIKPGECWVRVRVPAVIHSVEERVLIKPEYVRYEIVPAEFKEVEKEIVVKPESVTFEVVPAQYETKEVEVVVTPEHTKMGATEPQFLSEETKREVKPSLLTLKIENGDAGELVSFLKQDAEFKAYARHLLVKPSQVQTEKVARAVEKVATQVLVKAAEVKEVKVPAEVKKITVRELVKPATKKEIKVPAEYAMVTRQHIVTPDRVVWQRVVCPNSISPELIKQVQAKLKEKGIELPEPDGQWNDATKAAVSQFQDKSGLPKAGLSYPLLEQLGIAAP